MQHDLTLAMAEAGFDPVALPTQVETGRIYRLPAPGKPRSDRSGWLVLHSPDAATFGDWTTGERANWRAGKHSAPFDPARRAKAQAKRRQEAHVAADQARALWASAKPAEQAHAHPYAARKGITVDGLRVDSRNRLLVPLRQEPDGPIVNLQTIDGEGAKRFVKGGIVKGAFYEIPGRAGPRVFCEGLATAATVAAATGRRAVVCFSAGNVVPVVAALAGPGGVIAADNDNRAKLGARFTWSAPKGGAGHTAAMAAGLPFFMPPEPGADFNDIGIEATREIFEGPPVSDLPVFDAARLGRVDLIDGRTETLTRCLADSASPEDAADRAMTVALRLCPRVPAVFTLAQVRERLDRELPPGMVHPATLDGIIRRIAELVGRRRRAALEPVSLPGELVGRHRHERRRELPILAEHDYTGVIIIKAPMGAGETQRIGRPFARWAAREGQVLAICHRVTLVAELAQRLGLPDYRRVEPEDPSWTGSMAVCLPSITSEALRHRAENAEYLFIDEVAQVLRFVRSEAECSTRAATNEGVFAALRALMRRAKCVIVADAGIDRRTLEFLESCRPGERFRIVDVQPATDAKITAEFEEGVGSTAWVLRRTLAEVEAGGNVWMACESALRALSAQRFLEDQGIKVIAVTAANRGNPEQAALLADIENRSRDYRVVIASPVIGSGVSIEHSGGLGRHFTMGAVLASGAALTPADVHQMARRVR